jgi:hypothetical protein
MVFIGCDLKDYMEFYKELKPDCSQLFSSKEPPQKYMEYRKSRKNNYSRRREKPDTQ